MEESKGTEPLGQMNKKVEALMVSLQSTFAETDPMKRGESEKAIKNFIANDSQAFEALVSLIILEAPAGTTQSTSFKPKDSWKSSFMFALFFFLGRQPVNGDRN